MSLCMRKMQGATVAGILPYEDNISQSLLQSRETLPEGINVLLSDSWSHSVGKYGLSDGACQAYSNTLTGQSGQVYNCKASTDICKKLQERSDRSA